MTTNNTKMPKFERAFVRSIYIHVPFCKAKCPYCDFESIPFDAQIYRRYLGALEKEMDLYGLVPDADFPVVPDTIYIGGGTPTVPDVDEIEKLLALICARIDTSDVVEWTVEANPGTITREKIDLLMRRGVNRISLGVQSFDDKSLASRALARSHSSAHNMEAIEVVKNCGIENFSLDLIYAVPDMTMETWVDSLRRAIDFGAPHISVYSLSYEDGTPLKRMLDDGSAKKCSEDAELEMYLSAVEMLSEGGLFRYEVSNFAKAGYESLHNSAYWDYQPVLALGASASGFLSGRRYNNVRNSLQYISLLEGAGSPIGYEERLAEKRQAAEVVYLALRRARGITDADFRRKAGIGIMELYGEEIERLSRNGLVDYFDSTLRLTDKGFMFADTVMMEFF